MADRGLSVRRHVRFTPQHGDSFSGLAAMNGSAGDVGEVAGTQQSGDVTHDDAASAPRGVSRRTALAMMAAASATLGNPQALLAAAAVPPAKTAPAPSVKAGVSAATGPASAGSAPVVDATVPIRRITQGPKFHWFAYYDKLQFSPDNRFVLCNQVEFENRSPRPDDVIRVGMIDLQDGDRWIELGESRAWSWQQGCMLQWLPGSDREVIWNDREGDHYVSHILDVKTRRRRTVPHPIYSVSPDGTWAITTGFSRLQDMRPGYGYAGVPDPFRDELAPKDTGIFRVDLRTGRQRLLVSVADLESRFPYQPATPGKAKHWFNHLLINPDGTRFVFLHRWRVGNGPLRTHMIRADADGSNVRLWIGSGYVSHFFWRDASHMLAFSKPKPTDEWGFFVYEDAPDGRVEEIGKGLLHGDGHCTYLPVQNHRWVLNDAYRDAKKIQRLHLYDTQARRRIELGGFLLPDAYMTGAGYEFRVDLHPRFSRDGRLVTIDSPHEGLGRQLYLLDLGASGSPVF